MGRERAGAARWGVAILSGTLALAATAAPSAAPELISRVPGNQGADGASQDAAVTSSGKFVAFRSRATNLVDEDLNGDADVFVRDLKTGATTRVSVDSEGGEGNGDCHFPAISANGRFVLFSSDADDLVADDGNESRDVFLHDRKTGETRRVSVDEGGGEGEDSSSLSGSSLSTNGRYAVFLSSASNLGPADGAFQDVFWKDLRTGTVILVSRDPQGGPADGPSQDPSISANGRFVAFTSSATNLTGDDDGNLSRDVFVFDRKTGTTRRASVDSEGGDADADSYEPTVSSNGRIVAFYSSASDLVPLDTNGDYDVFVHDSGTGTTRRVSVDPDGNQVPGPSYTPALSQNGKVVVFYAEANGLVPEDQNGTGDVYSVDLATGAIRLLSATAQGEVGDGYSHLLPTSLAGNGKWVSFSSDATNLSNQDRNGSTTDVFLVPAR